MSSVKVNRLQKMTASNGPRGGKGGPAQLRDSSHLVRKGAATSLSQARAAAAAAAPPPRSAPSSSQRGRREPGEREAEAEVLCILRNSLAEPVSLRVHARTPAGVSFLHDAEADLEPGGHMAFVAAVSNEVEVWSEFGRLELTMNQGRPSFVPREGTEQATQKTPSASRGLPPWVLTCAITASPQQRPVVLTTQTLFEAMASDPELREFTSLWRAAKVETGPEETVIALEDDGITDDVRALLRHRHAFEHLRIPCAVFVTQEGGSTNTIDGASVHVRPDGNSAIIEIDPVGDWPPLRLAAPRRGQRTRDRWHVLFPSRVIL